MMDTKESTDAESQSGSSAEENHVVTPENLLALKLHAVNPNNLEALKITPNAENEMQTDLRVLLRHIRSGKATDDEQQAWIEISAAMKQRLKTEQPNRKPTDSEIENKFYLDAKSWQTQVRQYRLLGEDGYMELRQRSQKDMASAEKLPTVESHEAAPTFSDEQLNFIAGMLLSKNGTEIHAGSKYMTLDLSEEVVAACRAIQKDFSEKHRYEERSDDRFITLETRQQKAVQALAELFASKRALDVFANLGKSGQIVVEAIADLSNEVPVDILKLLPAKIEPKSLPGKDLTLRGVEKTFYTDKPEHRPYELQSAVEEQRAA